MNHDDINDEVITLKNNPTPLIPNNKILFLLRGLFVLSLAVMIAALCIPVKQQKSEFTPPAFEASAVTGTPKVADSLGYTELYQEGMAYRVSVCGVPTVQGQSLTVYFTNTGSNEKYLKLRVLDETGAVMGETGLLRPGEYVENVSLTKALAEGTKIKLKIMGYEPQDYTSAGSVVLNVAVRGVEN